MEEVKIKRERGLMVVERGGERERREGRGEREAEEGQATIRTSHVHFLGKPLFVKGYTLQMVP